MRTRFYGKLLLIMTACLTLSLNSCVKEKFAGYDPGITSDRANVILRLKTPGSFSAPSRALTVAQECKIDNVHILAFKGSGDNLTLSYIVAGVNPTSESTPDVTTFQATLAASDNSGDTYRLMIVANAQPLIESVFGADLDGYSGDKSYAAIQQALNKAITGPVFPASDDVIPMWGDTGFKEIKANMGAISVNMIRSISRIDVGVGAPTKQTDGTFIWNGNDSKAVKIPFEMTEVYVIRPNKDYAVTPELAKITNNKATAPSLIAPAAKFTVNESVSTFIYTDITTGDAVTGNSTSQSIYIPEANIVMDDTGKPGDANHTSRMAVVVGGSYNGGATTYYRLDFIDSGKNLKDALRNHLYQFNISSVSGPGYPDAETAYESLAMNMTATVLDWDEGDMDEIYFDGQYYFGIDKKSVIFSPMGGETVVYNVATNVPDWTMHPTDDAKTFGSKNTTTYLNADLGFDYSIAKIDENKYTLTVKSIKPNIVASENACKELLTIKAKLLRMPFTVEQLSSNLYISVVNGQSARLYPEGTYGIAKPTILPIDIMALKPVEVVISGDNFSWLTVRKNSAAQGAGTARYDLNTHDVLTGLYSVNLEVDVAKWASTAAVYAAGSRSATITVTPLGEDPIVYTIIQESPYLDISRSVEYIPRVAASYTVYVEVQTNIATEELSLTTETGSSQYITTTGGLVNIDPTKPRNIRYKVEATASDMDAIRNLGDVATSSTFTVATVSNVYGWSKSAQFIVPTLTAKFFWIWNGIGVNSISDQYVFPWNTEAASVTFDSNSGLQAPWAATWPTGVGNGVNIDRTQAASEKFTANFTFRKSDLRSTDKYTVNFNNDNASRNASVKFWSGYQEFRKDPITTTYTLGYAGLPSATSLGDVYANVNWTPTASNNTGGWLTFSDNSLTGFTSNSLAEKLHRKDPAVPVTRIGETYPAAGTTLDTKTTLYYKVPAFTALDQADREAKITITNADHDAARHSTEKIELTITQFAPVLTFTSSTLPEPKNIPTAGGTYTFTASANIAGCTVKAYNASTNVLIPFTSGGTFAATAPYTFPTGGAGSAGAATTTIVFPATNATTGTRTIIFKLFYPGITTTFASEVAVSGTWTQTFTIPVFPAYPGVIGIDGDGRLNLDGNGAMMLFKFGSVVGFTQSITNGDTWKNEYIRFNPMSNQNAITGYGNNSTTLPAIPGYVNEGGSSSPYGGEGFISSSTYHKATNIALGKGDPCKFIGATADEIRTNPAYDSGWRLPKNTENQSFSGQTANVSYSAHWDANGTKDSRSEGRAGGVFPTLASGTTASYLPAAGYRYGSNGATNRVGSYGYYWSSTVYSTTYGYGLSFYASLVYPLNYAHYAYGFTVRCVRQ